MATTRPTITGTVAHQQSTNQSTVDPFSGVTITDPTGGTETLVIRIEGSGGTLSGMGLQSNSNSVYSLSGSDKQVTTELDALTFTPTMGKPGSQATTHFRLTDRSSTPRTGAAADDTTTVVDSDTPSAPAAPRLTLATDTGVSHTDGLTSSTTPTVTGNARPGSAVTIYAGNTVIGQGIASASTGAYSIAVTGLSQGANAISATQTIHGLTSLRGAARTIVLDTTAPIVTLASAGGVTSKSSVTLTGTVSGADSKTKVSLFDNGGNTAIATAKVNADGTFKLPAKLIAGANALSVVSTDGAGNVSRPVSVTYVNSQTTISLDQSVSYSGGAFTISGSVSNAGGVKGIEIYGRVGGQRQDLGAATVDANGRFTFTDAISAHTQGFITATETNNAGGSASARASYSLTGGLPDGGARQDRYSADGSALTATAVFKADGSQKATLLQSGQTFASSFFDTFQNDGVPDTTFVFNPGFGRDVVDLFRVDGADHDTLSFKGSDYGNDIAAVLNAARDTKAGLLITDPTASSPGGGPGTHDTLLIKNINKQQLAANGGDIAFHA